MYIDECNADNNEKTLGAIVARIEMNDGRQGFQNAALQILKDFLAKPENADIANLKLITYTENLDDQYTGACDAGRYNNSGRACEQYQRLQPPAPIPLLSTEYESLILSTTA